MNSWAKTSTGRPRESRSLGSTGEKDKRVVEEAPDGGIGHAYHMEEFGRVSRVRKREMKETGGPSRGGENAIRAGHQKKESGGGENIKKGGGGPQGQGGKNGKDAAEGVSLII